MPRRVKILFAIVGAVLLLSVVGLPYQLSDKALAQNPGYRLEQYQSWFANGTFRDHRIDGLSQAKINTVPTVSIPGNPAVGRPDIKFKLAFARGTGTTFADNTDNFIFDAYEIRGGREIKLPNLYLVITDECTLSISLCIGLLSSRDIGASGIVYSTSGYTSLVDQSLFGSNSTVIVGGTGDGLSLVRWSDIVLLFRHVFMNTHQSVLGDQFNSCQGPGIEESQLVKVGPLEKGNAKPFLTKSDIGDIDLFLLNGNCIDLRSEGWLRSWGIAFDVDPQETCSLKLIQQALNISAVITTTIACFFFDLVRGAIETVQEQLTAIHGQYEEAMRENFSSGGPNPGFLNAWVAVRGLLNIVVVIALLAIAFANILHLNINTYAAKKALPGLVIGVIGANASLLVVRFLIDVGKALSQWAVELSGVPTEAGLLGRLSDQLAQPVLGILGSTDAVGFAVLPFLVVFIIVFGIFTVILLVTIFFFLIKRLVIIYGLAIISPVAFIAYGLPPLQKYFFTWWNMILGQIFFWPALLFGFALIIIVGAPLTAGSIAAGDSLSDQLFEAILLYASVLLVLKIPGLMTKGAYDLAGAAKKAFGMARTTPQTSMRLGGGGLDWARNKRAAQIEKKYDADKAKEFKDKFTKVRGKVLGNFAGRALRGSATVAANPEVYQDVLKKRFELGAKARKLEAYKVKTGDVVLGLELAGEAADKIPGVKNWGLKRFAGAGLANTLGGPLATIQTIMAIDKEATTGASRMELAQWFHNDINKAVGKLAGLDQTTDEGAKAFEKDDSAAYEKWRVARAVEKLDDADGKFLKEMLATPESKYEELYKTLNEKGTDKRSNFDLVAFGHFMHLLRQSTRARRTEIDMGAVKEMVFKGTVSDTTGGGGGVPPGGGGGATPYATPTAPGGGGSAGAVQPVAVVSFDPAALADLDQRLKPPDEDADRISQHLQVEGGELKQEFADLIAPAIKATADALGHQLASSQDSNRIAGLVGQELKGVMTARGQNSLRGQLDSLGSTIARAIKTHAENPINLQTTVTVDPTTGQATTQMAGQSPAVSQATSVPAATQNTQPPAASPLVAPATPSTSAPQQPPNSAVSDRRSAGGQQQLPTTPPSVQPSSASQIAEVQIQPPESIVPPTAPPVEPPAPPADGQT